MNNLSPIEAFNAALDIAVVVVMLTILFFVIIRGERERKRMSVNLKMLIIVFLICSIADFGTWYLLPFSADSVLFEICLIVDYDLFQISIVLMHLYIIAVLEDRISFGKVITYAPLVVCAVLGVL